MGEAATTCVGVELLSVSDFLQEEERRRGTEHRKVNYYSFYFDGVYVRVFF